jgi:hypothetical protein
VVLAIFGFIDERRAWAARPSSFGCGTGIADGAIDRRLR